MIRRAVALVLALTMATQSFASPTPPTLDEAKKKEAKARFDRGLKLFDEGDKAGALAELEKACALVPSPIVLYDLALVHASMGHAVEAVDALERLFADPTGLLPHELAQAKKTMTEQSARVGEIVVSCDVDGARVELDNLEVEKTPLKKPLRVTAGTHVVGLFATGRIPSRKAVTVAGRASESVQFELAPLSVAPAQLAVSTSLPDVDVFANGALLGTTPLAATLALAPGSYEFELRRRGYRTAKTTLALAAGGSGTIALEPEEDEAAIATIGGLLEVIASEPGAVITVDRRVRDAHARVAPGMHRVRVERAGFVAFERDVFVETGTTTRIHAQLEATAETRFASERAARNERTLGYVLVGSGVALVALGGGFLAWNAGKKATANDDYERILFESEPGSGRRCDPRTARPMTCSSELDASWETYRSARGRDLYGWIGVGVGAAAAITGVVVLLRADSPTGHKNERTALVPSGWFGVSGGGLALSGTF